MKPRARPRAPLRRPTRRLATRMRARMAPMRGPKRPKLPSRVNRRRRLKVPGPPKVPKVPNSSERTPFELLQDAVMTLKEAGTASLAQIRRRLQQKKGWRIDKASNNLLTTALQRLAQRGKVIKKEGCKYRFNVPNDSPTTPSETSRSGTKTVDSHISAAVSSSVDTDKSTKDAATDREGRSSTGDISTSASSTASSKRR